MASPLHIQLLGGFRAAYDAQPLRLLDPLRLQALLAWLVLRADEPQDRQHLAFTFWPDSAEAQARTNLRQLFHHLRHALPDPDCYLAADRRTLLWRADAPATVDVVELERALRESDDALAAHDPARALVASRRAAELYRGDLLPSCYDAWIESDRERLRGGTVAALARAVELLEAQRDYGAALEHANTLRRLDPLREEAHQAAIRLHALNGEPALALSAYRDCAELFERELGIEPGSETRALHDRLRRGGLAPPAAELRGAVEPVPLVGRHEEWQALIAAWERASRGRPGVALVTGEPGIGKTRLAEALEEWAARQGIATARARSHAAEGRLPYAPVADWLRCAALREALPSLDPVWRDEVARLLPELDSPGTARPGAEGAADPWRRTRLFEALARAVLGAGGPLLLLLDDLQWCDGDTLEWLHYLLRYQPDAPLLVLATLRSGESGSDTRLPRWLLQLRDADRLTEMELGPLGPRETGRLAAAVAGCELEPWQQGAIHAETEGNPLFVVEIVRARLEDGGARAGEPLPAAAPTAALPPRVHTIIRSRLEQLSRNAREVAGLAATAGREFSAAILLRAGGGEEETVAGIDELLARKLVRERDGEVYDFAHDKIREVAYAGLSSARRMLLHGQVARALEAGAGRSGNGLGAEIAGHLERCGRRAEAISRYREAAARAMAVFAYGEAEDHLRRALGLLDAIRDDDARAERELELQTALGAVRVATDYYSGSRVWQAYTRARELAERTGQPPSPPVLRGLALASLARSRLPDVLALARALLRAARRERDPVLEVEAHYVLGVTFYWQGRLPAARRHLERALERYDPERAREHLRLYAQDPAIICGIRLALALWHLGSPERAHRLCLDTLERAEALGHPLSLTYARHWGTWVLIECGDLAQTRRHVVALSRDTARQGLAVWPAMAAILEGWLRVEDGDGDGGLERMRQGAAEYRRLEMSLGFPYQQGLLARAGRRAGRPAEAIAAIDEGLAMSERTGERFWDAELFRLRGELLLALGEPVPRARACFQRALDTARAQSALSLELRAALALARLEADRGPPARGVPILEDVCRRFSQTGESCAELREARELLALVGARGRGRTGSGSGPST
jgi:DNA-binding SARP family transcriptional activator/predicted ATPase